MPEILRVRVLVRPKAGILDPQGEAVKSALPALGFGDVKSVHVGRLIEMELESTDEVDAMCQRLLANPTIEEYEWEVVH
jgi:phosphoribosylformylglycinamidine synthase PurS subunit